MLKGLNSPSLDYHLALCVILKGLWMLSLVESNGNFMSCWGTKQTKLPVSCFSEWECVFRQSLQKELSFWLKCMHKLRHYSQLTVNLTFSTTNQRGALFEKSTLKHIRHHVTDADVYFDFSAENDAIKLKLRWKSVAPACFVFVCFKYSEVSEMYCMCAICIMHISPS